MHIVLLAPWFTLAGCEPIMAKTPGLGEDSGLSIDSGSEDDADVGDEENQENGKQENGNPEEEEDEGKTRLCPACGFKVDMGSSICVVCGNTLS